MGRRRALAGTREGYRPCPTCGHMLVRHLAHGTGPCTQLVPEHVKDDRGRTTTTMARCACTGDTITKEI